MKRDNVDYERLAAFFKALSHPVRMMIVTRLLEKEECVNHIRELLKIRQPNISQHLSLLRLTGIVGYRKAGKTRCYFLKNPQMIKGIIGLIRKSKRR